MIFPFEKLRQGIIDIGIEPETYDNVLKLWIDDNGDTEQSKKDFIWKSYQDLLQSIAKGITPLDEMYRRQREVYLEMFYFLCKEEKPRTVAQAGINHCDLQRALLSDINLEVKILGMKDCKTADEYANKTFSVEDAIRNELIPNMKCKRQGGCVCMYTFIPIFPLEKNK